MHGNYKHSFLHWQPKPTAFTPLPFYLITECISIFYCENAMCSNKDLRCTRAMCNSSLTLDIWMLVWVWIVCGHCYVAIVWSFLNSSCTDPNSNQLCGNGNKLLHLESLPSKAYSRQTCWESQRTQNSHPSSFCSLPMLNL